MPEPLIERAVELDTDAYRDVFAMYEEAFPPEERIEPEELIEGASLPACSFTAYYEGSMFCGFTYEILLEHELYLLFLAVDSAIRSRGYGSRILDSVKRHACGLPIVLDIEPLESGAPNAEQRIRRLRFYERNGFSETGYQLVESGVTYTLLATEGFAGIEAFERDFKTASPGLADFEIVPQAHGSAA